MEKRRGQKSKSLPFYNFYFLLSTFFDMQIQRIFDGDFRLNNLRWVVAGGTDGDAASRGATAERGESKA